MCWKIKRKNLDLGKIIFFSFYIWCLNNCFPSHTGELFSFCIFLYVSLISTGISPLKLGTNFITLTFIMTAIRTLLWTATAQYWPNSSTASYAFSLGCSALFLNFILIFHVLLSVSFSPCNSHHFCILPLSFSFLLNKSSNFQNSFFPFSLIFLLIFSSDRDPSSIHQHFEKRKPSKFPFWDFL